jgi:hypothetical protein
MTTAGGYIQATDAVSRPTAILMTIFGILLVGGLLFGIFSGTRWAYGKLTDKSGKTTITQTTKTPASTTTTTKGPSITATTSTATTTPSTPAVTPPTATAPVVATTPVNTSKLPQTGAGSNIGVFVTLTVLGYIAYRKKLLKN